MKNHASAAIGEEEALTIAFLLRAWQGDSAACVEDSQGPIPDTRY